MIQIAYPKPLGAVLPMGVHIPYGLQKQTETKQGLTALFRFSRTTACIYNQLCKYEKSINSGYFPTQFATRTELGSTI